MSSHRICSDKFQSSTRSQLFTITTFGIDTVTYTYILLVLISCFIIYLANILQCYYDYIAESQGKTRIDLPKRRIDLLRKSQSDWITGPPIEGSFDRALLHGYNYGNVQPELLAGPGSISDQIWSCLVPKHR